MVAVFFVMRESGMDSADDRLGPYHNGRKKRE
jgi:hypothetical protein